MELPQQAVMSVRRPMPDQQSGRWAAGSTVRPELARAEPPLPEVAFELEPHTVPCPAEPAARLEPGTEPAPEPEPVPEPAAPAAEAR